MASWFVDSSPVISTWLPSLLVVTSLLVLVMVIVLCTCWDNKSRNLQPACLGLNNLPTQQPQMIIQTNGSIPCKSETDPEDSAKLKVPTLQRKLPDIPVIPLFDLNAEGSDLQTNAEGSELYATVNPAHLPEANDNSVEATATDAAEKQIVPKVSSSNNLAECSNEAVVSPAVIAAKDTPETVLSSGDSFNDHPYAHVHHKYTKVKEHPYDRLRGQNSEEQDTDTDNYEDPHVAASNWAAGDAVAYEPLPPVPEKRFDLSEIVPEELPVPDSAPTAANAMSGRVSASDIPFVTSPIESPTTESAIATGYSEPAYNSSQESGNGQEIRYTSISVREPLANLKVQIQSLSASAKQPNQQDSESYYAVVQEEEEEVDQTYAEIESGHTSATNSVTYAHIEPAGNMPPRPPPVESLRCIAQVHSRQASTSSVGNALSPESDQQPSCLPFPSTSSAVLPDQQYDSCVMRKDRRTIHVTDSESLLTTNLEDMYAKVLKDKRFSLRNVDSIPRLPPPPLVEHISSDSVDTSLSLEASPPPGMHGSVDGGCVLLRRESSANDPGYEKIRDQLIANKKASCANFNLEDEVNPTYQGENSSDPGYETVGYQLTNNLLAKDNFDPGYEWVRDDPGYETVGEKLSNFSNAIQDPGYETIKDRLQSASANDPGYESIRENQEEDLILGEDPAYESVRDELGIWFQDEMCAANLEERCIEHGYEVLHRPSQFNSNTSQLYETVRYSDLNCDRGSINYQQPDYESVIPPLLRNSSQELLPNVNLVSVISIHDSVNEFPPSTSQNQEQSNEEASFSNVAVEQLDLCSDTFIEMEQNETVNQNLIKNFEKNENSVEEITNEKETNVPQTKDIR